VNKKTKEKLLAFPNLDLKERDFRAFDTFASLTETPETLSKKMRGVVDEGSLSKIITLLENLSEDDLRAVEVSILDSLLDSSGFYYDAENDKVIYETDCEKFRFELKRQRNFLTSTLRCLARRLSDKGKGNVKSLTVSERQLFYYDVYRHFIEDLGITPPDTPDGWFVQFMKVLTSDPDYRALGLFVADPRPFIRKARQYVRDNG